MASKRKFDDHLIELVRNNPVLYNGGRGDRNVVWDNIYKDIKNCMQDEFQVERTYLPVRWKSIRDKWVRQRKNGKQTPEKLDFLIGYAQDASASQLSRISDESQSLTASQSFFDSQSYADNEDKAMDIGDNLDPLQVQEIPVDYQMLQKKELWLKRTKTLKEKEEEMQILQQIRLANQLKGDPNNLRCLDPNFPRRARNSDLFAVSKNRLERISEERAHEKADQDWCELIVQQILSVEDPSKRLQAFDAIMIKSKEFQMVSQND